MLLAWTRCGCSDRRFCFSVMLTLLLIMSWCTWHPEIVSLAQEPDQPEKASILIAVSELASAMKEPNLRIVDARSQDEYAKGHLAGAMWVDVNDWKTLATADAGLRDTKGWSEKVGRLGISRTSYVVVYGDRLSDTARIWWLLKYLGVERVAILDGGWQWCVKEGRPAEKTSRTIVPTSFKPNFQLDRLEEIVSLKKSIRAGNVQVVDARSADEFTGKDVRGKRGGRIPGAAHLEWKELLSDDGRFKTREELRALFRERGILPDETAVCY